MSESHKHPGGWRAAFSVVLSIGVFGLFLWGSYEYLKGEFIDYERNLLQKDQAIWLIGLFSIPILLQSSVLIALFFRLRRDNTLANHYAICIFTMSFCPVSYCALWICYTMRLHTSEALSYGALVAIVLLLLPVILMTYAIMWKPPRRTISDVKEDDIPNVGTFCSQLKMDGLATPQDGAALGGYRMRILESLDNNLRSKLMLAQTEEEYKRTISKSELVSGLNRVLRIPDLHLSVNSNNQTFSDEVRELLIRVRRNLSEVEMQRLHRLLLDASFSSLHPISETSAPGKLKRNWEEFLSDIKEGITKAHFWVLANFFAVFLGVTFLFGFAFAFHDQDAFAKNNPDLYMAKTPLAGAVAQQLGDSPTAPEPEASKTEVMPRYTFYFDSSSAHLPWIEHPEIDKPYELKGDDPKNKQDWKYKTNYSRLKRITDDILDLTKKGQKLRVELVGSTDYCDLQSAPYSSNYELSEARAQKLKHMLIDELLTKDRRQRDIEWFVLPLSSEVSPVTGLPAGDTQVIDCENRSASNRIQKKRAHPDSANQQVAELENYKNTFPPMQSDLGAGSVSFLQNKVDDLKTYVRNQPLSEDGIKDRRERIDLLTKAMIALENAKRENQPNQTIVELTKDKTKKEVELQESLYELKLDEAAGMRIVAVSLRPVQESSWFMPLSLMDYMYFTIYTITTTGYGDIIPTTTFAKFLCSAANILEVFFLVVFFNALLSVRGENRFSRVTDKSKP